MLALFKVIRVHIVHLTETSLHTRLKCPMREYSYYKVWGVLATPTINYAFPKLYFLHKTLPINPARTLTHSVTHTHTKTNTQHTGADAHKHTCTNTQHTRTYTYTYIHTRTYTHTYRHTHTHTCTHTHAHTHTRKHTHMHTQN